MKALSQASLFNLYELYQDPDYASFFRHYPLFLTYDEFLQTSIYSKGIDDERGVALYSVYPRCRQAKLSIVVEKNRQGNGLGVSLAKDVCSYLFNDLNMNTVIMEVSVSDVNTNRIVRKGGFDLEATYKDSCFYGGKFHNENRYVMTKEDYFNLEGV